jgi:predicted HD phosphohydrolase
MTEHEAAEFEKHPDAELFIKLRYWDDQAKEMNTPVQDLEHLKSLAINHLYNNH